MLEKVNELPVYLTKGAFNAGTKGVEVSLTVRAIKF